MSHSGHRISRIDEVMSHGVYQFLIIAAKIVLAILSVPVRGGQQVISESVSSWKLRPG